MKKKIVKKVMAVALAVVMVCSLIPLAFAGSASKTPVVIVPGMGAVDLVYLNAEGTSTGKTVFPPNFSTDTILDIIKTVLTVAFPKDDTVNVPAVYDLVKNIAENLLLPLACNADGTSKYSVGVAKTWSVDADGNFVNIKSCAQEQDYLISRDNAEPAVAKAISDSVGAENVFIYKYDWRGDTTQYAAELNSFIEGVKAQTGASKVILVSGSMGTTVVSNYVNNYMANAKASVERCIYLSAAFQGTSVVGQMMSGQLALSKDAVKSFLSSMDLGIVGILLNGRLYDVIEALITQYKDKIYSDILLPMLGNTPGIWSVMDFDYYSSAVSFAKPSTELLAKVAAYKTAQDNFASNMKALQGAGVQFAVVAHYGYAGIPISTNSNYYSDTLIDTALASAGATVAPYGETVSGSGSYVSADGRIDASTALFKDSTWFIKNLGHMGYSTTVAKTDDGAVDTSYPITNDLIVWLVTSPSAPTVGSNAAYPQFTYVNKNNQIIPLTDAMATVDANTVLNEQATAEQAQVVELTADAPVVEAVIPAEVSSVSTANDASYAGVIALSILSLFAVAGVAVVSKRKVSE